MYAGRANTSPDVCTAGGYVAASQQEHTGNNNRPGEDGQTSCMYAPHHNAEAASITSTRPMQAEQAAVRQESSSGSSSKRVGCDGHVSRASRKIVTVDRGSVLRSVKANPPAARRGSK